MAVKISGGSKLKRFLSNLFRRAGKDVYVNAGVLAGATYPDAEGTPVAQVAYWNEFGTGTIPARPFMRPTIAENKTKWSQALKTNLQLTNYNTKTALGRVGIGIVQDIKKSIKSNPPPPNATAFITEEKEKKNKAGSRYIEQTRRKVVVKRNKDMSVRYVSPGQAKTLQSSGHLLESIDYEVKEGQPSND